MQDALLVYKDFAQFQSYARALGIMDDEKAGVPRTSYKGVVYIWKEDRRVFLVSSDYRALLPV